MRTWWRWIGGAVLLVGLASSAQAAMTWQVATDQDCTAFNAATALSASAPIPCCRTAASGGGNYCSFKANMGANFVRSITIVAGAAGTYTNPGGDALPATQLAKIGLTQIISATCTNASNGMDVLWNPVAATAAAPYSAKIQLFAAGAGVTGGGELANATSVVNVSATCLLIGY